MPPAQLAAFTDFNNTFKTGKTMFGIYTEAVDTGVVIVKLVGEVTVENAEQLHQILLENLREQQQVMIDCEQMSSVDIFAVQLLCSAHRTSVSWNKLLTWHGTLPEVLTATITEAGFAQRRGCGLCPDGVFCIWSCQGSSIRGAGAGDP